MQTLKQGKLVRTGSCHKGTTKTKTLYVLMFLKQTHSLKIYLFRCGFSVKVTSAKTLNEIIKKKHF